MEHIREKYSKVSVIDLAKMELLSLKQDLSLLKQTLMATGLKETTFGMPSLQALEVEFNSRLRYMKKLLQIV